MCIDIFKVYSYFLCALIFLMCVDIFKVCLYFEGVLIFLMCVDISCVFVLIFDSNVCLYFCVWFRYFNCVFLLFCEVALVSHRRSQNKRIYLRKNIFEAWKSSKIEAGYDRCSDSDFAAHLLSLEYRGR